MIKTQLATDILTALDALVAETFTPEAVTAATTQKDKLKLRENALGILLATVCDFDGTQLMRVAAFGLEDANYHTESEVVMHMAGGDL